MSVYNIVKTVGLTALSAAAISGFVYFKVIKKSFNNNNISQIPLIKDDILISFLKDLKQQSYPHFFLVSNLIKQITIDIQDKQQLRQVKKKLIPDIEKLFAKKQYIVLVKYNYTYEEFQAALESTTNARIIKMKKQYYKLYSNALKGRPPKIRLSEKTIADFPKERIFKVSLKVLINSIKLILEASEQLIKQYGNDIPIHLDQPQFLLKLHELEFNPSRRKIYLEENILTYEEKTDEIGEPTSPTETFAKLSQYHKVHDLQFQKQLKSMEDECEQIIQKVMNKELERKEVEQLISQIDIDKYLSIQV